MNVLCRLAGHRFSGLITGFRDDGLVIGRCARCDMPIIHPGLRGAPPLVERNKKAIEREVDAEIERGPAENMESFIRSQARSFIMKHVAS